MGVDFVAYSRVVVRPVPSEHMRAVNAAGLLEHRPESRAWVAAAEADPAFIAADWGRGLLFARSPETEELEVHCSYGGFARFNEAVAASLRARGLRLRFPLPDTDFGPCNGLVRGDDLQIALRDYGDAAEGINPDERPFLDRLLALLRLAADGGLLCVL